MKFSSEDMESIKDSCGKLLVVIALAVLVITGSGCLNYGTVTGEGFYSLCGTMYFIMLACTIIITLAKIYGKNEDN